MTFSEAWPTISKIEGWLTKQEAEFLFNEASRIDGDVLEVGSFKGRSAITFALSGRNVTCVDPFDGPRFGKAIDDFRRNTAPYKTISHVQCYSAQFESLARFKLIFIDADHVWPHPLDDFNYVKHCLDKDGVFLFHDYNHHGVERTIEKLIDDGVIIPLGLVGTVFKAKLTNVK